MITKENLQELADNILEKLKSLNPSVKYHLSSDEGGMLGNPKWCIQREFKQLPYYTYIGELNKINIGLFILGRLLTWQMDLNTDYSKTFSINVEI